MIERSRVGIPAGAAGEFSSPGSTFCADSYRARVINIHGSGALVALCGRCMDGAT